MSKLLTKREVERLTAALDACADEDDWQQLARLRDAVAAALASLVGQAAPWPELVDAAASIGAWSPDRVRALKGIERVDETIDALYDLVTELNETRKL